MKLCPDTGSTYHPPRCSCITDAAKAFPATFGLRAFPGDTFRIGLDISYLGGRDNTTVMLYTEIKRGDSWHGFAKGTREELLREVVAAP